MTAGPPDVAARPRGRTTAGAVRHALYVLFGGDAALWSAVTAPVVFVAAFLQLAISPVDPDYWWHITTGRWMLAHGRIPFTDPFSFTHGGQNWYAHEWLAELCFGVIDRIAGYAGEIVVTALVVAAGGTLLARAARYYGVGAREALLLLVGAAFFILGNLAARPQVWGWALFALLLHELAAHDNGRRRTLWHLPLLFMLWINVHLSVLLGAGVFAIYGLHRCLLWLLGRPRDAERRRLALGTLGAGVLSGLALCVNPRGPALIWFTRVYLNQRAERYAYISEWQKPQFSGNERFLFVGGTVVVLLVAMAIVNRRRIWPGVLVPLFALAALRAIRYVPLFAEAGVPGLAWVGGRFRARTVSLRPIWVPWQAHVAATGAALLVLLAAAFWGSGSEFRRTPDPALGGYPVAGAAWVKANVPDGPVFNEYGWGGYLISVFYPQRRVYMDGREEMYGETFFKQFVQTVEGGAGWQQALAAAGVRATILDPRGGLAQDLAGDPGWRKAFSDSVSVVYVPVGP